MAFVCVSFFLFIFYTSTCSFFTNLSTSLCPTSKPGAPMWLSTYPEGAMTSLRDIVSEEGRKTSIAEFQRSREDGRAFASDLLKGPRKGRIARLNYADPNDCRLARAMVEAHVSREQENNLASVTLFILPMIVFCMIYHWLFILYSYCSICLFLYVFIVVYLLHWI